MISRKALRGRQPPRRRKSHHKACEKSLDRFIRPEKIGAYYRDGLY